MNRSFLFSTVLSILLILSGGLFTASGHQQGNICVTSLTTEMSTDPVGVGTTVPRLSWKLKPAGKTYEQDVRQTGYRILVASSVRNLNRNVGDLWDSGNVSSDQSVYIKYGGKPLSSGMKAYWKVKVATNKGDTDWSDAYGDRKPSFWQMSLLDNAGWKAEWIGGDYPDDLVKGHTKVNARYLRKEFTSKGKISSAVMYICGLGLYEAYVNGSMLGAGTPGYAGEGKNETIYGSQMLAPTLSYYDNTVYFNTFDVTSLLRKGGNALGVILGNGRYTSMRMPGVHDFGIPKLLLQLEITYKDGSKSYVVSDGSWKITEQGPIRTNNEWDGEVYDANMEMPGWNMPGYEKSGRMDGSIWQSAGKVKAPSGVMKPQPNPNIRIMDFVKPVSVFELSNAGTDSNGKKTYILDMGQNMVGVLLLRNIQSHAQGDTLTLRFAETLKPDSSLYVANLRSAEARDTYICKVSDKSKAVSWYPSFIYHGFRYVELKGFDEKPSLDDFTGLVIYDDMASTASFHTSNEVINTVFKNAFWGIRGNYRGMPTDCPQRDERMGWMGDRTTGCYGESYLFDNHLLYSKWLQDIEESQTKAGGVPDVAPAFWKVYSDNITWPGVFITAADMIYRQFGDVKPMASHYSAMKKWLVYMKNRYGKDGIMTKDRYGDWCMPPESLNLIHSKDPSRITAGPVLSTAFYYHLCGIMSNFASILGNESDCKYFADEALASSKAFNAKYFNEKEGYYANNTVTANILPLYFGMVPEGRQKEVFARIVDKTMNDFGGHVSTGVVGIEELMRGLTEFGSPELALKIASNDTYPSWGYMAKHGATTIWELWNGNTADPAMNSGNHVMLLGDLLIWDMGYIGGISAASPGYKTVMLKPYPVKGLDYANVSYESIHGTIASNWEKDGDKFSWDFTIPYNTTGNVYFPVKGRMAEKDMTAIRNAGGTYVGKEDGFIEFTFPSGSYSVTVDYPE